MQDRHEDESAIKRVHSRINTLARSIGVQGGEQAFRASHARRTRAGSILRGVIADEVRSRRALWFRLTPTQSCLTAHNTDFYNWESIVSSNLSLLLNRPLWDCEAILAGYSGLLWLLFRKGLPADAATIFLMQNIRS